MKLNIEIVTCENGYIILDGNSMEQQHAFLRKKWVVHTPKELGDLVEQLARAALDGGET